MTSTLTVVGKRGKCTINVGKNDLELLPLLEVTFSAALYAVKPVMLKI